METYRKEKNKILLIEPPSSYQYGTVRILGSMGSYKTDMAWPPYDLMIIGGYFKTKNINFEIIDANAYKITLEGIKKIIFERNPEMVIFNVTVPTLDSDMRIAGIVKEISPKIFTAAFNLSIKSCRVNVLEKYKDLDFLVYSEPELPLYELILNQYCPIGVRGIHYREKDLVKKNEEYPKPVNLDIFGIPAQENLSFDVYRDPLIKQRPMTIVNCSRGCSGICDHCLSIFQRPLRYRSVENVIEELDKVKSLSINEIKFFDCGLTNNIEWADSLFEKMIKKNYNFSWNCNSRADCLPSDTLKLMKKSGCHTISIGSESANQQILNRMNKRIKVEQVKATVKNVRKVGIAPMLYFTFGLPGENKDTIRESIEFAKAMNPDIVTFGIAVPVYGTPFYDYLEKNGYLMNLNDKVYDPNNLPPYSYPGLSSQEIYDMSRQAYRQFYMRFSYIIGRLFRIRNFKDFENNWLNFRAFLQRYVCREENCE